MRPSFDAMTQADVPTAKRGRPSKARAAGAADTRDLILDAAEQLFSKHGFYGVTIREVAREAGVDTALVHYYFGAKRALFDAVFLRRAEVWNNERVDAINRSAGANFGKRQTLRPQHSMSLTADWQTPFGLSVGSSLLLIGDSFDDAANSLRLNSYALVGLRASMPLTDALEVYSRIDNLLGADYTVVAGYNSFGRNATIGVRAKF